MSDDQEFAAQIALAFQPGMGEAILTAEAEDRARTQAALIGADGEALIQKARHRYIESPRAGQDVYREVLDELVQAAIRGDSGTDSGSDRAVEAPDRAQDE